VAYAIAGTTQINLDKDPIGQDADGNDVMLADIWPSNQEIRDVVNQVSAEMFGNQYDDVFTGPEAWQAIEIDSGGTYAWENSTYIKQPPFFTVGG
ncbi:MAG TPA: aconitate hydratase, partial [Gammaproteobacteria bacterium]|nr:aconitate hydratase [Gammaproteobacteria bacterium]